LLKLERPVQKMSFAIFETSRLTFFESRMVQSESICYGVPVGKLHFRKNSTKRRRADQGRVQRQAATLQSKSIYVKPLCENSSLAIRHVVPGSEALQSEWIHESTDAMCRADRLSLPN
jgi:hypothetical protein